jgi:hypothetical protein
MNGGEPSGMNAVLEEEKRFSGTDPKKFFLGD